MPYAIDKEAVESGRPMRDAKRTAYLMLALLAVLRKAKMWVVVDKQRQRWKGCSEFCPCISHHPFGPLFPPA